MPMAASRRLGIEAAAYTGRSHQMGTALRFGGAGAAHHGAESATR